MNWKWSISDEWKTLPEWTDSEFQTVVLGNELVCLLNSKETGITSWVQIRRQCFRGSAFFLGQCSAAEMSSKGTGRLVKKDNVGRSLRNSLSTLFSFLELE